MNSKLLYLNIILIVLSVMCLNVSANPDAPALYERRILDVPTLHGHPGYAAAANISGVIDKVLLVVSGFDTENDDRPEDELDDLSDDLQGRMDSLLAEGWDVMYFEYVDGGIDLKHNANNLAHFIRLIDSVAEPDYHLAVVGGSMGGIVVRTMFVQEYSDMGVDTYVSVDAPHHGVNLSNWVDNSVASAVAFYMLQHPAGLQMFNGHRAHNRHYGWLRETEDDGYFLQNVIDPMATCAIALSDGEASWQLNVSQFFTHNKWYPVASYLESDGLKTTYMPYHSAVYMNDSSTLFSFTFGGYRYKYKNTDSHYFDVKIPNPRFEHDAPDFALNQAIDFVLTSYR